MGICTCHGQHRLIVVKAGLCKQGNDEKKCSLSHRVRDRNERNKSICRKRRNGSKKVFKKATGELELFKEIYEERGPYSQISKQWVGPDIRAFSHILSKKSYPAFRLKKENIIIKTPEEHHLWETQRHKLKDKPEWKFIFELEKELKKEYYAQAKAGRFKDRQ